MRQNNVAYMELWLLLLVRKHKELLMKILKMLKVLPIQVSGDSVEDFGAVLVFFPLGRVELQHRFIHQIFTTLKIKIPMNF